jgi:superfamily II RNA helicase
MERIMNRGYLEAIFATSTVAAGVNFPARTVVLVQSDRYNGHEFTELTATELHQMIGRAGRRGKDHIGFALIIPGRYQDPQLINELKRSPPEPIVSQIHINFSMTLNLLLSHSLDEVKDLLERSFAAFQETGAVSSLKRRWDKALSEIKRTLARGKCDTCDPFEVLENIRKRSEAGEGQGRGDSLPCDGCQHLKICPGKRNSKIRKLLKEFKYLSVYMEQLAGGLWLSFKHHVRFLKETGFVDQTNRLTPDGLWASNLRLDQPLLIAEAIRKGALEGDFPENLAGALAPFVWDRDLKVEVMARGGFDLKGLEKLFYNTLDFIQDIKDLKKKRGFESPPILFWPSAALYMWARGVPWERLLEFIPIDEGDMASLIMRTADHLRQVMSLRETHPGLASVAEEAVDLILREPVYIV